MLNFRFTDEQEAFRGELRAFLDAHWHEPVGATEAESLLLQREFERELARSGYLTMSWPLEYGGRGAGHLIRAIYSEEVLLHGAPYGNQGVSIVGPALMLHGSDHQKETFIPPIARGEVLWCQGYSEPGAGSDLASLQTRAARDGDEYVVNGQKIWTSNGYRADWMHLLVRTDPEAPKHRGITYLLVDMRSPGIDVHRIQQMSGAAHFCEVFFEDVRVPMRNRLGEENRGWYIATSALDYERSGMMFSARLSTSVNGLVESARRSASPLSPNWRPFLADAVIWAALARLLSYRVAWMQESGLVPNHEASQSKLFASEALQRVTNARLNLEGRPGQVPGTEWRSVREWLDSVSLTIAGGTSEVQRNIMATRGVGLPRA